jgi:hypothetical protein
MQRAAQHLELATALCDAVAAAHARCAPPPPRASFVEGEGGAVEGTVGGAGAGGGVVEEYTDGEDENGEEGGDGERPALEDEEISDVAAAAGGGEDAPVAPTEAPPAGASIGTPTAPGASPQRAAAPPPPLRLLLAPRGGGGGGLPPRGGRRREGGPRPHPTSLAAPPSGRKAAYTDASAAAGSALLWWEKALVGRALVSSRRLYLREELRRCREAERARGEAGEEESACGGGGGCGRTSGGGGGAPGAATPPSPAQLRDGERAPLPGDGDGDDERGAEEAGGEDGGGEGAPTAERFYRTQRLFAFFYRDPFRSSGRAGGAGVFEGYWPLAGADDASPAALACEPLDNPGSSSSPLARVMPLDAAARREEGGVAWDTPARLFKLHDAPAAPSFASWLWARPAAQPARGAAVAAAPTTAHTSLPAALCGGAAVRAHYFAATPAERRGDAPGQSV